MAFLTLARSIQKTQFLSTFQLIPTISSSLNRRRHHHHCPPSTTPPLPPVPKKIPFTVNAHGVSWEDPYHWMSNTSDPDFVNYLHQENSYTEAFMSDTKSLQQKLCSEMKCRISHKISTPPARWGPWFYYEYIPEGKEYPVLCRKLVDEKSWVTHMVNYVTGGFLREEVLLDWNEIAEQYGYVSIGTCRVSPNHNFLAYTVDPTGSEHFILQVKDLLTGRILPRFRVDGVLSLAWAQDGCTLFYTLRDENQRPYRLQCTNLESDIIEGVPIHTENDTRFTLDITSTKDGKFITVNSNSWTSSEVFVIDAANLKDGLQRVHKRVPNVRCFLEHHHGFFYILTNAPQCKGKKMQNESLYLARCRVEDRQLANWQRIIVPSEETSITDMDIFNEHLVLFLNSKDSGSEICSINMPIDSNFKEMDIQDVDPWYFPTMPENTSSAVTAVPGSNHDFMTSVYRVVLSTPVTPDIIVDYDMSRRTYSVFHQEEVVGFPANAVHGSSSHSHESEISSLIDTRSDEEDAVKDDEFQRWSSISDSYSCERKDVTSHDGEMIPLTILFSKKAHQKGQSPGLLQGYGAYGDTVDKSWSADRLSLLDRGWVVAFADVRGGGGSDPSWHASGKGLLKSNSIHDFVSCAEYLINEGYVHKCRLGALGASAGGLLVGAAINMYPDLFRAAILNAPFLDTLNTLLDPSLPLTVSDYEEFGNPQIESEFRSILSYSPYDNIPQGVCLPAVLVTASYHDSRVGVWEAAKWVAKVREISCSDCSQSVILKTSMIGGHYREGGLHCHREETAYEYAFLMKVISNSDNDRVMIEEKENKPMCISSNPVSDYCDLRGDVRIDGNSSTIYICSSDRSILAGKSLWRIKPYPRKGNVGALKNVREWKIILVEDCEKIPSCNQVHNIPAVIFSLSGYTHNLFHDFTDVLIPMFSNIWKFDSHIHLLNTDYRPLWISRFQAALKRLSGYPVVNIDKEKEIRCYRNVIVSLERDKALDIDPSRSASGVTMNDFRRFVRSTYSLKRYEAIQLKDGEKRKPRLMIISRAKRRKWRNLDEIIEVARGLGFDVVVGEANRTSNVLRFAHIVNSCDLIMGIHGAGLANMVYLPDNAIVIQVIPLGAMEAFAKETFEDPAKDMNLPYLKYKIDVTESSLIERYKPDDPVITDPLSIHKQGWEVIQATYLDKQDIRLDMKRFRHILLEALDLLHH